MAIFEKSRLELSAEAPRKGTYHSGLTVNGRLSEELFTLLNRAYVAAANATASTAA